MRRASCARPRARFATVQPVQSSARTTAITAQDFCRQTVQQKDRDHYACALFLPKKSQDSVFAVRALNIELASLRDAAKQGSARTGRLQFWRRLVDDCYKGQPPDQPIAKALAAAVKNHQLTKGFLLRILDAREKDLSERIPLKIEEHTASALLYLTLESCGVKNANADHAASHVGKAYGLVTILRGLPYTAAQRQTYVPLSLLNKHNVVMEDVFRGQNTPALQEVVWELASNANVHLEHARTLRKTVPIAARSALLPGVIASAWLARLQKCHFNVFDPELCAPDPWQFARLYWAHMRGRY